MKTKKNNAESWLHRKKGGKKFCVCSLSQLLSCRVAFFHTEKKHEVVSDGYKTEDY